MKRCTVCKKEITDYEDYSNIGQCQECAGNDPRLTIGRKSNG